MRRPRRLIPRESALCVISGRIAPTSPIALPCSGSTRPSVRYYSSTRILVLYSQLQALTVGGILERGLLTFIVYIQWVIVGGRRFLKK